MDPIIRRLQARYRNAYNLLDVFTHQLQAFEHGRTPDLLLVRAIVDGLNRYLAADSDGFEAALVDELTRADTRFASARLVLTTEYGAIRELGEHCLERIEDIIIGGTMQSRSEFLIPARRYLRMYRSHLKRERCYLRRHERGAGGKQEEFH